MLAQKPNLPFPESNQLMDSLPVAVYICDIEGRITYYNKAAAELWGRNPELFKDLWCGSWKIYYADGTPMDLDKCPMAVALKEGKIITNQEIIIERTNGDRRNVLPHPQPILDLNGTIIGAINTLVDITEKKYQDALVHEGEEKYRVLSENLANRVTEQTVSLKAQNTRLKKSEGRYHKMIEEVRDYAILLLDVDGTILNWNKGAENIKGYTEEEIIGKNFRIFYLPEDRESKLPEKLIQEAVATGKAMNEGYRLRKDGTRFWGSIVITALHDEQDNIIGFSKVTRDLTEKKLAEDQLKEYARNLEIQNTELAQFSYIASHDLQEPLRKIQTFLFLCASQMHDRAVVEKYFTKINLASERMSLLIKNLLEYSHIGYGEMKLEDVDLNKLIESLKTDFELLLNEKQATLISRHLPVVKGVPFQLYQLFSNLLSNALKFNERQPVINISAGPLDAGLRKIYPQLNSQTSYIHLIFKDNGIGFDPVYSAQIFGLFNRLNAEKKFPGSGVGLAICKKIVESHHGHISAQSEINKGTTINIFFPIIKH